MNYKSGSQWRKWDLHVHTPESIENRFAGSNKEEKWDRYIANLEQLTPEVKVLGINDYLFIDGYRRILQYKQAGRLSNIETVFPVIEFRVKKFAGNKDFKRVNFHVIFSNEISCDLIQSQFLNGLQGKYKLAPGLSGIEWNGIITPESLADLGRTIKSTVPVGELGSYGSDLVEGFCNLNLDEEEIIKILRENSYLKSNHILAIGKTEWDSLAWGDSSIAEKKDIINKVDLVFISSATTADYERARKKLVEQGVNSRLLDCSDAHHNIDSDQKDRIGKCFTWIKSDTTFSGLKQAVLEFDERVYIGERPSILTRVRDYPTKYIQSLSVRKVSDSEMPEVWFEGIEPIPLNSQLVTIIGNKGSGKSAIADIIGLCGNSQSYRYNSFLTPDKFLKHKPIDRASSYLASITWASGQQTPECLLSSTIDENSTEMVKYLPQSYLEKLCSEELEGVNFEGELKEVVFSHMSVADRLGQKDFDAYLEYRSSEISNSIDALHSALHDLNSTIADLEQHLHPSYASGIEQKIKIKQDELLAHQQTKPSPVEMPAEHDTYQEQNKDRYEELEALKTLRQTVLAKIDSAQKDEAIKKRKISDLGIYCEKFTEVERYLQNILDEFGPPLDEYDIRITDILTYNIDMAKIASIIEKERISLKAIEESLDPLLDNSLISQREECESKIHNLVESLSEPYQKYQTYQKELEDWRAREAEIVGDCEKYETLRYFENEREIIKTTLPKLLEEKVRDRLAIVHQIYQKKETIIGLYKMAYDPVMQLIRDNKMEMGEFNLSFDAQLTVNSFIDHFLEYINQSVKGTFCGKDNGYSQMKRIMDDAEYHDVMSLDLFLSALEQAMCTDCRDGMDLEVRFTTEQLRKGVGLVDYYDFIYGLDYLMPSYRLRLGSKELSELSPGERGSLLLIFYLLLDKSNVPLIIDQPEENLDNQSVYDIIVKFIKKAKDRRQVIVVTHNPNLAVVCDSDQVIRVMIDKENGNRFSWIAGAIENKEINDEIVRILEGTMPAFWNRKQKYENVSR